MLQPMIDASMKTGVLIIFLLLSSLDLWAQKQDDKISPTPSLEFRQVSGVILDSLGNPISMANIKLISAKDSLLALSDKDGIFIFEKVRSPIFVITTSSIGFKTVVNKYLNNNQTNKIVLAPVILTDQSYQLKQVNINGAPSVVYKQDTVEYRARDYKVPPYATIDQLLKQMEGVEVGSNGTLYYQGQQVTKAKLNGKVFSGGSVAQAILNLPANIADKIQIIDDYGDQAARTGIRNSDPKKVLNITTQADKSIGILATVTSQEGNNNRYNEQLSAQSIDANRVISVVGGVSSVVNGIASSNSTMAPLNINAGSAPGAGSAVGSSPGTTQSGSPTFSYTNSWNNALSVTGSYAYNFNNTNSISDNYGQINSSNGLSYFKNNTTNQNNTKGQAVKFELDYNIGKFDYLQVNPSFNYNTSSINNDILSDNLNYFATGFEHPVVNLSTINPTTGYNYGLTVLFVHVFKNPKRNFSIQFGFTRSNNQINGDKNTNYRYYSDTTQLFLVKDSLSHLLTFKVSNSNVYRGTLTYVEPVSKTSQIEVVGQMRDSRYNNIALSDTVLANGQLLQLARLSDNYDFYFLDSRLSVDYNINSKKSALQIGAAIVPSVISGTQLNNNTNNDVSTFRSDFRIIPVFRYTYNWSIVERLQISYSGTNNEPNFQQIQPFIDRSDPNNIIIGNSNLKPTFTHNIAANYNKYYPNEKLNLSFNINALLYENQVANNIIQVTEPISSTLNKTINEINFVNLQGDKTFTGNYSISKQFDDRDYNLALNGYITYGLINAISNDLPYHTTVWDFNERLGPRITLNNAKFTLNPFIGYDVDKSYTSSLNAVPNTIKTIKLAVDGEIYLPSNYEISYDASKNYISGFTGYNLNPLVINAGFQKRFRIRTQSLAFTFNVFDILHQNNFVQQSVTPQSTTYTLSNTQSRYFLLGLKLNLQKWGGTPMRNGEPMKRRGDGSFIN